MESWLRETIVPIYDAMNADPKRAVSAKQVRARLAAGHKDQDVTRLDVVKYVKHGLTRSHRPVASDPADSTTPDPGSPDHRLGPVLRIDRAITKAHQAPCQCWQHWQAPLPYARRAFIQRGEPDFSYTKKPLNLLVRTGGLEPPWPCGPQILGLRDSPLMVRSRT